MATEHIVVLVLIISILVFLVFIDLWDCHETNDNKTEPEFDHHAFPIAPELGDRFYTGTITYIFTSSGWQPVLPPCEMSMKGK